VASLSIPHDHRFYTTPRDVTLEPKQLKGACVQIGY